MSTRKAARRIILTSRSLILAGFKNISRLPKKSLGRLFACGAGGVVGWKLEVVWQAFVFGPEGLESSDPLSCTAVVAAGVGLSVREFLRDSQRSPRRLPHEPETSGTLKRALREFLLTAFSIEDLKAFVVYSSCCPSYETIDWAGSKRTIVNRLVTSLFEHGAIGPKLFDELLEERRLRAKELRVLRAIWAHHCLDNRESIG